MLSVKVKPKAKDPFEKPVSLAFAVNEVVSLSIKYVLISLLILQQCSDYQ